MHGLSILKRGLFHQNKLLNPLSATAANMHQVPMLTYNSDIQMVNDYDNHPLLWYTHLGIVWGYCHTYTKIYDE